MLLATILLIGVTVKYYQQIFTVSFIMNKKTLRFDR